MSNVQCPMSITEKHFGLWTLDFVFRSMIEVSQVRKVGLPPLLVKRKQLIVIIVFQLIMIIIFKLLITVILDVDLHPTR
jgi:hypothetical protein